MKPHTHEFDSSLTCNYCGRTAESLNLLNPASDIEVLPGKGVIVHPPTQTRPLYACTQCGRGTPTTTAQGWCLNCFQGARIVEPTGKEIPFSPPANNG